MQEELTDAPRFIREVFSVMPPVANANYAWILHILLFDVPELCRSVPLAEIREKDYSFAPSKYIEFIDHDLEIDYPTEMNRMQNKIRKILALEKISQTMLTDAFRGIGYEVE